MTKIILSGLAAAIIVLSLTSVSEAGAFKTRKDACCSDTPATCCGAPEGAASSDAASSANACPTGLNAEACKTACPTGMSAEACKTACPTGSNMAAQKGPASCCPSTIPAVTKTAGQKGPGACSSVKGTCSSKKAALGAKVTRSTKVATKAAMKKTCGSNCQKPCCAK